MTSTFQRNPAHGHDQRSRAWCGTWNNYTEEEYNKILNDNKWIYIIIGKEGATTDSGTPHLQFYLRSQHPVRFVTMKNAYPKVHWEPANGSIEQNITYCSKEGSFEEKGTKPSTDKHMQGLLDLNRKITHDLSLLKYTIDKGDPIEFDDVKTIWEMSDALTSDIRIFVKDIYPSTPIEEVDEYESYSDTESCFTQETEYECEHSNCHVLTDNFRVCPDCTMILPNDSLCSHHISL